MPSRATAFRPAIRSLASLFASIAVLFIGSGLLGVLIPLRATLEGFPTITIGLLGTTYYVGFVAGCLYAPRLVYRVGHIRTFAALAALAASAALTHALLVSVPMWLLLRGLLGFCFAGLFMVIESWLNGSADKHTRGQLLSIYMVVNMGGITSGKLLLATSDPAGFTLFAVASLSICVALVPVALTRSVVPAVPAAVSLRLRRLYRLTPIGVMGCLIIGLTNGAFWTLGPVFAEDRFAGTSSVAFFMSAVVVGGMLGQWPLGKLSDRIDRRKVIMLGSTAAAGTAAALIYSERWPESAVLATAVAFGMMALPVYSLCIAHANDFANAEEFVEVSSELLLLFGVGAMIGPFVASSLVQNVNASGLFMFTAPLHLALAGFALYRMAYRTRPPAEERTVFKEVPKTSQALFQIDPRAPTDSSGLALPRQP